MTDCSGNVNIAYEDSNFYYVYPKSPDALKLYTDYGLLHNEKSYAVKYLEHMLSKTSLTTKTATHLNIKSKVTLLFF